MLLTLQLIDNIDFLYENVKLKSVFYIIHITIESFISYNCII